METNIWDYLESTTITLGLVAAIWIFFGNPGEDIAKVIKTLKK